MILAKDHAGGVAVFHEPLSHERCELLRIRAELLVGQDRALMKLYLEGGNSFRRIARLTRHYPSSVARRIRRITKRLLDETYPLCLQNRAAFSVFELAVIKDHFVRGYSCDRISRRRHTSSYRIRTIILTAKRFAASAASGCEPTPHRSNQP